MIHIGERTKARRIPDSLSWGVGLAFAAALVSGVSIFVNAFAVRQLPDAAVYTTLKNGVAAILLAGLAALTVRPTRVRTMSRASWIRLLVIGVVGGGIPFLLFFGGLAQASAPSAAFIHKTLFVWVALLATPFLGERLGLAQVGALAILFAGQFLAVPPTGVAWGPGETMIAAATLLWAVEMILAKRLLATVPSGVVGAGRLGFGLVVLVGYLAISGRLGAVGALSSEQWAWVLGTGLLLSGYVATWFAALRRAPASLVTAVLVVGAPITAILQAAQRGALPATPALMGQVLIAVAAILLGLSVLRTAKRRSPAGA